MICLLLILQEKASMVSHQVCLIAVALGIINMVTFVF